MKWYEVVSRIHHSPLFVIDMPFLYEGLQEHSVAYVVGQMRGLISFLEEVTGEQFTLDRFLEVLLKSIEAMRLWTEILETCIHSPAPMSCFDAFIHLGPIVTLRGTQECIDYYRVLKQELCERIEQGIGVVHNEHSS